MQQLKEVHGVPTILDALRFVSLRVRSAKETAGLAADLDDTHADLAKKQEAWRDAVHQRRAATAEVDMRNKDVDAALLALSRHLLAKANGDRSAPAYRTLFPTAPSEVVNAKVSVQSRYVEAVLAQPAPAGLEPQHAALKEAQQAFVAASAARDALYAPEALRRTELDIAADGARALYNRTYSLAKLALDNARRVESFFPPLVTSRRGDDGVDTPGETPEG